MKRDKNSLIFLCLLFACAAPNRAVELNECQDPPQDPRIVALRLLRQGENLSKEQMRELELDLLSSPDNLEAHITLLGYYSRYHWPMSRQQHIFWLIEHDPSNVVFAYGYTFLNDYQEKEAYTKASALWKEQVFSYPNEPLVLGNAAEFFSYHDSKYALSLLETAEKLEPENPEWKQQLGRLHYRRSAGPYKKWSPEEEGWDQEARWALEKFEEAYALTKPESLRPTYLPILAKAAFAAKEQKKAKSYADELLAISKETTDQAIYGEAVYYGNLILGRLALLQGDVSVAKAYLLAAGKTPGSPALNSYGPNMSLAKELLEAGERETVLTYFELCSVFWSLGSTQLAEWTEIVQAGRIPKFSDGLLR